MELPAPDLLKTGLTFSADGRQLFFLGAKESEPDRTDIYAISENAPKPVLAADAGGLKSAPIVDPAGQGAALHRSRRRVRCGEPRRRRRPVGRRQGQDAAGGAGRAAGRSGWRERGRRRSLRIVDIATRKVTTVVGSAPSLSADGQTLDLRRARRARIQPHGRADDSACRPPSSARRMRLDAPALSADGSRIAYQMMPRDDWEIFVADRDGDNERQVTHEIQHDLLPRFIGADRLLAVMGEPRHRRSYLYDLGQTWVRPGSDP